MFLGVFDNPMRDINQDMPGKPQESPVGGEEGLIKTRHRPARVSQMIKAQRYP